MEAKDFPAEEKGAVASDWELALTQIRDLLVSRKWQEEAALSSRVAGDPLFQEVWQQMKDLRQLSIGLSKGDLSDRVKSRGYVVSNLKAVQANLRHLTWQSKHIAQGDYSQTVDFLGEISEAFNDMTEKLNLAKQQLMDQANLDALTNVPNRLALNEFLAAAFGRFQKNKDPMSLLLIDVDHFKQINDTYGHLVGDEVLRVVAKRLEKQVRGTDFFARFGGEEFVAALIKADNETSQIACARMLKAISGSPIILRDQQKIPVTISVGLSAAQPEDTRYEDILLRSDMALYKAKEAGRNCYRTAESANVNR